MVPLAGLLGTSGAIAALREQVQQLLARGQHAHRLPPILLQGETGTGKGLLAGLIHRNGPRAAGAFVDVSCAAIPEALLEAELFGFEPGAFTDARRAKPGLLHAAHHGTLFLDEVSLLPAALQGKLLKAIEEQSVRRLGGTRSERVEVQIIAASNEDLAAAVDARRFRLDLFHRLAVVTLTLPPLRQRQDDILLLAEHFLVRACAEYGLAPARRLAPDARRALQAYAWPGNVRELSNVIERAVLLAQTPAITAAALRLPARTELGSGTQHDAASLDGRLGGAEREQLLAELHATNWNVSLAAIRLGITRNRLRYRIEKHGLRASQHPVRVRQRGRYAAPAAQQDGAQPTWERRHLAMLRAELVPHSRPSAASDSTRALGMIADKIRTFGGDVQEIAATTVLAAFGLESVENAPGSAALAALAIQKAAERARRIDPQVAGVKLAIHAAQLPVESVDGVAQISAEDMRATGSTLAGLSACGEPDSILVSASAAPFLERRFELERDGGPGRLCRLTRSESTGFGLAGRTLAQFVGREHELAVVGNQLVQAERDHGQVVAVVGEPGVGKSRFVYELTGTERARGWRVLSCQAVAHGIGTPSLPVIELMRRCCGIDDADAPGQVRDRVLQALLQGNERPADDLPALLALLDASHDDPAWRALEPAQRRQRSIDAVKRVLLRESLAQPLLVIFEDLHWIDTETQGLLDSLVDSLPVARVLLLVTYRPEYEHRWDTRTYYTRLRIDPLAGESAEALLRDLVGDDVSLLPLKRLLLEHTEGNPLFLEECVRALAETATLQGQRGAYRIGAPASDLEVPATVHAILAARIDRLPPDGKRLLQAAAVIGKDVPLALLRAVAGLEEEHLGRALGDLQTRELLYEASLAPDAGYTFKHALTQEVAYQSLLPEARRALHGRIVDALERLHPERQAEQIERLAHHALRGARWEKAVTCLAQAGSKAFARSANREAAAWFEQALEALAHCAEGPGVVRQGIDLRFDLRSALHPQGAFGRILDVLQEAQHLAERVHDQERLARALAYLALTFAFTGAPDRALAAGHRASEIAQQLGNNALAAAIDAVLGMVYQGLGRYRQSMRFNDATIAALAGEATRERAGMPVFPAVYSRHVALLALAPLGEFDEAAACSREGFRIAEAIGHPLSTLYMYMAGGFLHAYRGEFPEAIRLLEHGRTLCEVTGARLIAGWVACYLGYAHACSGRIDAGLACLEEGVDTLVALGVMLRRSFVMGWLGEAYAAAGRFDDAARCADQALELARAQKERGHEGEALRLLGDIAARRGGESMEAAEAYYREALRIGQELEMRPLQARCHLGLGASRRRAGNLVHARPQLVAATDMLRAMGMQYWLGLATAEVAQSRIGSEDDEQTRA